MKTLTVDAVNTSKPRCPSVEVTVTQTVKSRRKDTRASIVFRCTVVFGRQCFGIYRTESAGFGLGSEVLTRPCQMRGYSRCGHSDHMKPHKGKTIRFGEEKQGNERESVRWDDMASEWTRITGQSSADLEKLFVNTMM